MSDFYGVIYIGTCSINGKQYVGQTVAKDPFRYIRGHFSSARNGSKKFLHKAIRKYGEENFIFEIIWHTVDKASLDISENSFIELFETTAPNGYNLRGGGSHGKHSEASKALIKATLATSHVIAKRAVSNADPLVRKRHREGTKAALAIPEVKDRQKAGLAKPEVRLKILAGIIDTKWINNGEKNRKLKKDEFLPLGWVFGRINSFPEKSRAKMRATLALPENKQKREEFEALPETKLKRQKASHVRWAKPGAKEQASDLMRIVLATPEAKEKRAVTEIRIKPERRAAALAQFSDPIFLEQHRVRMTEIMNDPIVAARHKAAYDNPITKAKILAVCGVDTRYINDGENTRRIHKDAPLPFGWVYGVVGYAKNGGMPREQALALGRHVRWHVRRGINSPECPLCNPKNEE